MKAIKDIIKRKEDEKDFKDFKDFIDKEEKEGNLDISFARVREEIRNLKETD